MSGSTRSMGDRPEKRYSPSREPQLIYVQRSAFGVQRSAAGAGRSQDVGVGGVRAKPEFSSMPVSLKKISQLRALCVSVVKKSSPCSFTPLRPPSHPSLRPPSSRPAAANNALRISFAGAGFPNQISKAKTP
jgi:hypothetical protein